MKTNDYISEMQLVNKENQITIAVVFKNTPDKITHYII